MDSGLGLTQQQQLRQKLNPAQVRFGRLLEMSAPEFEDEIRRVADENPALEVLDRGESIAAREDSDSNFNETSDELVRADYADPDDIPPYRLRDTASHTAERYDYVAAAEPDSAADNLLAQLSELDLSDTDREIAAYIIGNLDSNGYLTRSPEEIADDLAFNLGLDVPVDEIRRAWDAVRGLDPAGIAAADLRDCLILQLERRRPSVESRTALEILRHHFDLFSKKHTDRLAAVLDIPESAVRDALDLIRTLNPKPGALLERVSESDRLRYIVPDFTVDTDGEGGVTVSLNGFVPEMAIEESFRLPDEVSAAPGRPDVEAFVRSRRDEAAEFIFLASMRARTLLSVMRAIVRLQAPFFKDFDRAAIRPMVLRDVQAVTGLDLSVISRATATKYVATPRGIYPLKMFFNERVGSEESDTSQHAVMEALATLVRAEDPAAPLSDARLGEMLAAKGFEVARRTVSKYRERLGIPVARLRRR